MAHIHTNFAACCSTQYVHTHSKNHKITFLLLSLARTFDDLCVNPFLCMLSFCFIPSFTLLSRISGAHCCFTWSLCLSVLGTSMFIPWPEAPLSCPVLFRAFLVFCLAKWGTSYKSKQVAEAQKRIHLVASDSFQGLFRWKQKAWKDLTPGDEGLVSPSQIHNTFFNLRTNRDNLGAVEGFFYRSFIV